jgi:hypothetical protein
MRKTRKKITMVIEKTRTGFSAYADSIPVVTTAKNIIQLMENAVEAVNLYYEEEEMEWSKEDLKFEIDLMQFFQYYRVINSKYLAQKINMNPTLLSHYVQGHKRPSLAQTEKILNGIHQIGKELSSLNFVKR